MSLYGAAPVRFTKFEGLAPSASPLELPPEIGASGLNVDCDGSLRKRLGRVVYNSIAPVASRVRGVAAYYPPTGNRITVMQAGTKIYADVNRDGDFGDANEEIATITGGRPMDFLQWRDILYCGNGIDALQKWTGSSTATAAAILTAPAAKIGVAPVQTQLESFSSATEHATDITQGWVRTGNDEFELSLRTDITKDGAAVQMTAEATTGKGTYNTKEWSAATKVVTTLGGGGVNASETAWTVGSTTGLAAGDYLQVEAERVKVVSVDSGTTFTVLRAQGGTTAAIHAAAVNVTKSALDLSGLGKIILWVWTERVGTSYQIAVLDNAGNYNWDRFPVQTATVAGRSGGFQRVEVPLSGIAPSDRNASAGFSVKYVDQGSWPSYTHAFIFDDAKGSAGFADDEYSYYYTYAQVDGNGNVIAESNPVTISGALAPTLYTVDQDTTPISGLTLTVPGTAATGVTKIRIYRLRKLGSFARARLVTTLTNPGAGATATYVDQRSDEDLLTEDAPEMVVGRMAPPLAFTYCIANARLWAGNITLGGTQYPWRLYGSRLGFPEEFSDAELPFDPNAAGWINVPTKDHIVRIVEHDGTVVVFCNRSIWTLQGSGWDDFSFQKRADVGLDAREAVVSAGRALLFLASDGVRVLLPHGGYEGSFETWVVSEPFEGRLREIPAGYRSESAMGVDHRGRVHLSIVRTGQTVPDCALVFDPLRPGAQAQQANPARPGWTEYRWPAGAWSCYVTLKHGGGDFGQLLAGDFSTGKLYYVHKNGAGADLETDDAGAIAWEWTSPTLDAGGGRKFEWSFVGSSFEQGAVSHQVTHTPILDGVASGTTYVQSGSGSTTAGLQTPTEKRTAPAIRGRHGAHKISGSHSAAHVQRSVESGRYVR